MIEDTSLEFDMFEDVRRNLVKLLVSEGHERLEAEKIALYIVQGLRDSPKLLTMLAETDAHTRAEIFGALRSFLDNASALDKARSMLLGLNVEDQN